MSVRSRYITAGPAPAGPLGGSLQTAPTAKRFSFGEAQSLKAARTQSRSAGRRRPAALGSAAPGRGGVGCDRPTAAAAGPYTWRRPGQAQSRDARHETSLERGPALWTIPESGPVVWTTPETSCDLNSTLRPRLPALTARLAGQAARCAGGSENGAQSAPPVPSGTPPTQSANHLCRSAPPSAPDLTTGDAAVDTNNQRTLHWESAERPSRALSVACGRLSRADHSSSPAPRQTSSLRSRWAGSRLS